MGKRLIIILGSTACGKTELSLKIAETLSGEIISADSMQVYKKMDIGTAKITPEETRGIPHHLIDILEPDQEYSVAHFQKMALKAINEISQRGHIPIVVGGTGLYISSLISPYNFRETSVKEDRKQKEKRQELWEKDQAELYQELVKIDPRSAQKIHPNDRKRIVRALEVYYQSGETISEMQDNNQEPPLKSFRTAIIGLDMDRESLYRAINSRVDRMIQAGLVNEVKSLLESGLSRELSSMQGIGYKQIAEYLCGEVSLDDASEKIKRDTRHFAKRQVTWFKRDKRIRWFYKNDYPEAKQLADAAIEYIRQVFEEDDNN